MPYLMMMHCFHNSFSQNCTSCMNYMTEHCLLMNRALSFPSGSPPSLNLTSLPSPPTPSPCSYYSITPSLVSTTHSYSSSCDSSLGLIPFMFTIPSSLLLSPSLTLRAHKSSYATSLAPSLNLPASLTDPEYYSSNQPNLSSQSQCFPSIV